MNSATVITKYRNILGKIPPLPILTENLLVRQLHGLPDLEHFHSFFARHQELADTANAIEHLTDTRNGSLVLGIFIQNPDKSEGGMIGLGGVRDASNQGTWPVFSWHFMHPGYKNNLSLLTEFTKAFMEFWLNIAEEAGEFAIQVPASSVDYPQDDETRVAPRVLALASLEDTNTQRALAEAGFEKYLVATGKDGAPVTYWRYIATTISHWANPPASRPSNHETHRELEQCSRQNKKETSCNANNANVALDVKVTVPEEGKTCRQPLEWKPSNTEITTALWFMLAEDIESHKLDVFQLPVWYVEGYVPLLSKHFGISLENRRGEIWTSFETCLNVQRGNKAAGVKHVKQSAGEEPGAVMAETSAKAGGRSRLPAQAIDCSRLPPLREPFGRTLLCGSKAQARMMQARQHRNQRPLTVTDEMPSQASRLSRLPPLRLPPGRLGLEVAKLAAAPEKQC
ncbi:hypothetical protein N0V82_008644 [Gnomoniopsis sp. IMI 355080]|nr:hypothetical protein N0V82_008644 [Gnomoniopsis sp. IMI 355080]